MKLISKLRSAWGQRANHGVYKRKAIKIRGKAKCKSLEFRVCCCSRKGKETREEVNKEASQEMRPKGQGKECILASSHSTMGATEGLGVR